MARYRKKKPIWLFVLSLGIVILAFCFLSYKINGKMNSFFLEGDGTSGRPYLIQSYEDLEWLSIQVNSGSNFENVYFRQEVDLDFRDIDNWTPIGSYGSEHKFCGVYDGNGHSIQNITIDGNLLENQNVGLFGLLDGTVCNLKIENGTIIGAYIGTVASHGTENACIVNCSVSASLKATGRCGGIADNLGQGKIICCVSDVEMECDNREGIGGISSYSAGVIYGCQSLSPPTSSLFNGFLHNTKEIAEIKSGISKRSLEEAKKLFPEELEGLKLIPLE